jgi:rhodanese-related sulfurtransferase
MSWFNRAPNPLEITATEAHDLVKDGTALLVDVREAGEWSAGHARPAKHVPLGALSLKLGQLPRDREILVICRSGNRSLAGAKLLTNAGFKARSVAGGTLAWARGGLPLAR